MSTDTMISEVIKIKHALIPVVGLGTYKITGQRGIKSIEDALQAGYRHIDSAQMYGNEEEVGKAVRNSGIEREKIFVTTKVWPSDFKRLIKSVEESLRKFKMDCVDLLLLHWPSDDESNKAAIDLLNETLKKKYTKNIGVSNFNFEQLKQAMTQAPVICNQVEYHPYLSQEKMLKYLKQHDMLLTAYTPLARGKVSEDKTLKTIGEKYSKTASQVALRWLIQQGNVAVIPKASSVERIKSNIDIFDFVLSDEDMKTIFKLNRK